MPYIVRAVVERREVDGKQEREKMVAAMEAAQEEAGTAKQRAAVRPRLLCGRVAVRSRCRCGCFFVVS